MIYWWYWMIYWWYIGDILFPISLRSHQNTANLSCCCYQGRVAWRGAWAQWAKKSLAEKPLQLGSKCDFQGSDFAVASCDQPCTIYILYTYIYYKKYYNKIFDNFISYTICIYASNLSYVYIIYEKTPTEIDTLWCMMMFGDVRWYVMISDDEDYAYKIMCVRLCVSLSAQERASHRNTVECLPQDAAAQAEPPAEVPQNSLGRCQ
jgi:hypothetical protein